LDNTAAVAGLASAVTSFAKTTVHLTRAALLLQVQPAAAAAQGTEYAAAAASATACFPAAVATVTGVFSTTVVSGLFEASLHCSVTGTVGSCSSTSSSSSNCQAAASIVLLAVVLARSLVQLADAMQAVGPQLLFRTLMAQPYVRNKWLVGPEGIGVSMTVLGHTAATQWRGWQAIMLRTMRPVLGAIMRLDTVPPGAAASGGVAAPAFAAAAAAQPEDAGGTSSGSSGSGTGQQVKWGYLLQLQQASPRWAAAVAAFDAKWPGWRDDAKFAVGQSASGPSNEAMQQMQQQYTDTVELCRSLTAAAPLPLLCNNPGCDSLARVSEAAAASKRCAGCRCHYCSVECQRADWKRHKHACKSMAAAGLACV
jgi:hypothetical protein